MAREARVAGGAEGTGLRSAAAPFDAFISYSHAADGQLAPALQGGLRALAKPWYRRRGLRVFRDKTSLAASPQLWPAIEGALSRSRFFLLLASTEAARSHWIEQEVRWWRAHRSHDTLLIALTEGELPWDEGSGDFASGAAIPPALRGWLPAEPLWVDLRWARGARDLSMRNPRFRAVVADLAAPLRGVPKDELIGEDVDQHRRTLRLVRASVAVLVVLLMATLAGGVVALVQRNRAEDERTLAFARQLAAQSVAQQASDSQLALLLGMEAVRQRAIPEAESALREALAGNHLRAIVPLAERRLSSVEFSPDGGTILAAGNDGKARLIDVPSRTLAATFTAGPNGRTTAAFARRGRLVLTTNVRRGSTLWSTKSGRPTGKLPDRQEHVTDGAISQSGRRIATVGSAGVHLWTGGGDSLGVIRSSRGDSFEHVAISPDGNLLALAGGWRPVQLRRLVAGPATPKLSGELFGIESIGFDPSGRLLLAVDEFGTAQAWDVATGTPDTLLEQSSERPEPADARVVEASADGLLAVGSADGTLTVSDFGEGGRGFTTQTSGGGVTDLDLSPDGRTIATAQEDGSVRLFAVSPTGRHVVTLGPEEPGQGVAFSPDGRFVAETFGPEPVTYGASQLPRGTWVWRLADRKVWKVAGALEARRAAFSPDGRLLAVAGKRGTAVWRVFARRPILRFAAAGTDASFSPDGTLLAIAERPGSVAVRRVEGGGLVEVLPSDGALWVRRVAFSDDGSTVLVLGSDGVIRLWNREEGEFARRFGDRRSRFAGAALSKGGDAIVAINETRLVVIDLGGGEPIRTAPISSRRLSSVAFSADGRNVLVAGEQGRAMVFAAEGLVPVADYALGEGPVVGAAFGRNAAFVALAGEGGVQVYRCDLCASPARLLEAAEATAVRGLSPAERVRFLHGSD